MKIGAIIGEYNPFHNGHKYHIERTRAAGVTHIVSVMSGAFVQRGDVSLYDKHVRARTALENGVDLVIELPVRYSLMSAEGFARGAVGIISALGCVDVLSFGSESGDMEALKEASRAVEFTARTEEFDRLIKRGRSYPAALHEAMLEYYTEDVAELIASPNNTLAVEYLGALDDIASAIVPMTVKRLGAEHDGDEEGVFMSASAIRKKILGGGDCSAFAPAVDAPTADISRLERAILAKLRTLRAEDFERCYDSICGLSDRLYKAARGARSLSELYFLAKTKRFTLAGIRRAALCAFLGIDKKFASEKPAYLRVLGMNARGREILAAAKCPVPIDTSLKALSKTSREAFLQANLEARCTDIYSLAFAEPRACGADFTAAPVIINE
ncbi:MAG: nucleotidyltransferase family protein [Lachnospiraceae bacterium]|nr:nucleotidyltransferase family protein [Ruminococcus sp.]MCM1273979.1 nucleotidyltransferase family protein [Lachnospiraceae bacterium]